MNYYDTFFPAHRVPSKAHLQRKLHPNRFPDMPRFLAAAVAFVLDAEYVQQPKICVIAVTSDGGVFARLDHEPRLEHYIADHRELLHGWRTLMAMACLSPVSAYLLTACLPSALAFMTGSIDGENATLWGKQLRYPGRSNW
jgi:hypothetical protein